MYRPDGWNNPYSVLPEHVEKEYPVLPEWSAFEAGADAMLEGLRNSKEPSCEVYEATVRCIDGKEGRMKAYGKDFKGKLVFIPGEKYLWETLDKP